MRLVMPRLNVAGRVEAVAVVYLAFIIQITGTVREQVLIVADAGWFELWFSRFVVVVVYALFIELIYHIVKLPNPERIIVIFAQRRDLIQLRIVQIELIQQRIVLVGIRIVLQHFVPLSVLLEL